MKLDQLHDYADHNGNSVSLAGPVDFKASSLTFTGKNARVFVGEGTAFNRCHIAIGGSGSFSIGSGSKIAGSISIGFRSSVEIGDTFQATGFVTLRAVEGTAIQIGNDCLFARDISIRTTDGHPIYDATTRERLNPSKSVSIGDHVWLAEEVTVLKGVTIGDATIVGTRSVVVKSIPGHSVAAGIPARVVREGVTWEHAPGITSEEFYL